MVNIRSRRSSVALLVIAATAIAVISVVFYKQQVNGELNAEESVRRVATLMELPANEKPSVATVLDVAKLQDQPLFRNAREGDKVLVYTKSQKAILYRPSTNKIVEATTVRLSGLSQ